MTAHSPEQILMMLREIEKTAVTKSGAIAVATERVGTVAHVYRHGHEVYGRLNSARSGCEGVHANPQCIELHSLGRRSHCGFG